MATLAALAQLVDGELVGDPHHTVTNLAELDRAQPGDISFLSNPKYEAAFIKTRAGAVLVREVRANPHTNLIVCANPYLAMARVAVALHPAPSPEPGVAPGALVDPSATVDGSAWIGPGAVVMAGAHIGAQSRIEPTAFVGRNAHVGSECLIHPGAKLLDRCILDDRSILQSGAVIGSDGFGYAPDEHGVRHKIPQVGIVHIESDCEIGANSTIDRATFGVTKIGAGTKVDNLVQIAHNVELGEHCVLVSQSGIAGSTRIGDRVIIGAQAGIVGHVEIGDGAMLGARAGAIGNIEAGAIVSGCPALPHRDWLRFSASRQSLVDLRRNAKTIEHRLRTLEDTSRDKDRSE